MPLVGRRNRSSQHRFLHSATRVALPSRRDVVRRERRVKPSVAGGVAPRGAGPRRWRVRGCAAIHRSRTTAQCGTPRPSRRSVPLRCAPRARLAGPPKFPLDVLPHSVHTPAHGFQNRFRSHGGESHNQGAGPGQRRVGRYRLARAERLCRRASRDARAHHAPRPRARLHARRGRPQPRHPAQPHHRRVHGDGRGASGPAASVLPRGARRAQAARRRRGVRPVAVRLRAARQRLWPALLSQARPAPQRRRLRADRARPRRRRGAPARARGDPLRRDRHGPRGPVASRS